MCHLIGRIDWLRWIGLAVIVALAAFVRFALLGSIPPGLWYDEAIYALDALSIGNGNWPIFFSTEAHMREPLYVYSLAGFFALFGHSVLHARMVSAIWGTVTVALLYPISRRIMGTGWSLLPLAMLAVFRWHVHFSRTIFRALLPSFFIPLVVLFFMRWTEQRRKSDAVLCGIFLGAGMYTYLSFRFVPLMLICWTAWLLWKRVLVLRRDWGGLAVIAAASLIVFAPLGVDYVRHPEHFFGRTGEISMFTESREVRLPDGTIRTDIVDKPVRRVVRDLGANARDVALMWTVKGDHVGKHNLPHEPVFDPVNGTIFYAGVIWCVLNFFRSQYAVLLVIWLFLMAMTSVFSFGAPNLLRMQGATPAVALIYALGARWIVGCMRSGRAAFYARVAIGSALLLFACLQLWTYFARFPHSPQVHREFQKEIFHDPAQAVRLIAPDVRRVYVPTEMLAHPSFKFIVAGVSNVTPYASASDIPATRPHPAAVLVTQRSAPAVAEIASSLRPVREFPATYPADPSLIWASLNVLP